MWGFAFSVDFSLRPAPPDDVLSGTEEVFVTPAEIGLLTTAAVPAFSIDCLDPVVLVTLSDTFDALSHTTLLTAETFSEEPLTVPLFERTLCCFFLFSVTLDNLPSTFFSGVVSGLDCFFSTSVPCSSVPQ